MRMKRGFMKNEFMIVANQQLRFFPVDIDSSQSGNRLRTSILKEF